jgi:hypothetical protein
MALELALVSWTISIVKLIEITPNDFINADQIVEVSYEKATTRTEESTDESDYNLQKTLQVDIPSSIKITLSSGRQIDCRGAKADDLYSKLVS